MYASDLTHQKRAATNFRNLQLQKDWFATGQTIRILGQKGGNDYSYMTQIEEGCIADQCWKLYVPINNKIGDGPISYNTSNLQRIDLNIYDIGYGANGVIDDAFVPIPMGGMDFFFNEVNYGANVSWNSNNALIFGPGFNPHDVSVNHNSCIAVLMGNYDRLCSEILCGTYATSNGFTITKIIVSFSDYYTDTTNFAAGKLQIRLIKENGGKKRQFIEVGVILAPPSPGYSNNPNVTYFSGTQKDPAGNTVNQDSEGNPIDSTKSSPWDITNGTKFLEIAGSQYSTAFPVAGTTMLYESDKTGTNWRFTPHAYMPV